MTPDRLAAYRRVNKSSIKKMVMSALNHMDGAHEKLAYLVELHGLLADVARDVEKAAEAEAEALVRRIGAHEHPHAG